LYASGHIERIRPKSDMAAIFTRWNATITLRHHKNWPKSAPAG
jgi:hypothetical protein